MYGVNTGETSSNFPPISADDSPSLAQCLLISLFTQANSYGFHIFHRRGSSNLFIENCEAGVWTSWKKNTKCFYIIKGRLTPPFY